MNRYRLLALLLFLGACSPPGRDDPSPGGSTASSDAAEAFFRSIPSGLATRGPAVWLEYFEDTPSFFMVSDGSMVFPSRAAAETFLEEFAPQVQAMSLEWIEPRFEMLSEGLAVFATAYLERITMTDSTVSEFRGHVSGVMRESDGAWKLQHLHWSSPVDEEG